MGCGLFFACYRGGVSYIAVGKNAKYEYCCYMDIIYNQ